MQMLSGYPSVHQWQMVEVFWKTWIWKTILFCDTTGTEIAPLIFSQTFYELYSMSKI